MPTVTIYADQTPTTDIVSIIYDKNITTQQQLVEGIPEPSAEGVDVRNEIIAEYESRGYSFDGELDCYLYFKKDTIECDYAARQGEIDDLLANGYSITNVVDCQLTFEKAGFSSLTIQLNSEIVSTDYVSIQGSITETGEVETVAGVLVTTSDPQDLINEGYTFKGVIDCKNTWTKDIEYCEFDNKLKTVAGLEREGYTLIEDTGCQMIFEGEFEQCDFENKNQTIQQYTSEGYTLVSEADCKLNFIREIETLSNQADVYAFFDTTSMKFEDGLAASQALQTWFSQYQTSNPDYEGNLYIIPIYYERYVDYLDIIKKGTGAGKIIPTNPSVGNAAFNVTAGDWIGEIGVYPPNFDYLTTEPTNINWTPPTEVLMLAFVDEANSDYHPERPFNLDSQPTANYTLDFGTFLTNLEDFTFFKAVLYPIVRNVESEGGALILQSMAAIEGGAITGSGTQVDITPLINEGSPYTEGRHAFIRPLKNYGWIGVYDKTSPASEVFNSTVFGDELNTIILNAGAAEPETEEVVVEGVVSLVTKQIVETATQKIKTEVIVQEPCEIPIGDPEYFEDASFTIGYSPLTSSWISYYSFIPNYYINLTDHFKTGLNRENSSLWSHLLTNKSFQVFYGQKYPWILEVPVKEQFVNKTLKDVEYYLDAKKYSNAYDSSEIRNEGFNKAWVYNNRVNSGEMNLKPQLGLMSEFSDYPNTISNTQQEILYSDIRGKHRFNYFFDRVKSDISSEPVWKWDINQIHKELNPQAITFTDKPVLDKIRGDWFIVRLQQDDRTDLRYEFKWLTSSETINR